MRDCAATTSDAGTRPAAPRPCGRRRSASLVAALLAALACDHASPAPTPAPASPASAPTPAGTPHASLLSPEEAERLAAIGYNEFSEDAAGAGERDGVALYDRARASPGYNLCSVIPLNVAELTDMDGRVVNRWSLAQGLWLARCELLPSGDVLIVGSRTDPAQPVQYIARLSWSGEVLWMHELRAHHDIELTPRGELLTIVTRLRSLPAVDATGDVKDNVLSLFALDDGRPLDELSLLDTLLAGPHPVVLQEDPLIHTEGDGDDWLHANSIEWMPWPGLAGTGPLYEPANVLVSMRHQSLIAIVNWDRKELVWSWGPGELRRQHEATWLPDGNVLLFDNGDEHRRRSRILKVDPRQDRVVWQWSAPHPEDFYSRGQGTAQALPNGDVLVADSAAGEAFELAPDGTVVWRWLCSYRNEKGQRAAIRIKRYDPALVDAIIAKLGERPAR